MTTGLIAALDIGKTNAKLTFLDPRTGQIVWSAKRTNEIVTTAQLRQLDVAGIERWILRSLAAAPHKERVSAIVPVAHGAAAVLLDENCDIVAAPDYEDSQFDSIREQYERVRDPYADTWSPSLPLGLNLGRQLFFLEQTQPELFSKVRYALLYPQYWAWRLSGAMASEVTSLGCHSDLWRPQRGSFSVLASSRGWSSLFPASRYAGEALGTVRADVARVTGLRPDCMVACGIHDSNASYLQHLISRRNEPFAVISSGTWTVVMANRGDLSSLRASSDMLANVDAFGSPVATARFMGGREYDTIARTAEPPTRAALDRVLQRRALAVPSFAKGGPFAAYDGRLLSADSLTDAERAALATLYVSLMCDLLIETLHVDGDLIVDGPLAANPLFGSLLATWRPANTVLIQQDSDACAATLCHLAGCTAVPTPVLSQASPLDQPVLHEYRRMWRDHLPPAGTQDGDVISSIA